MSDYTPVIKKTEYSRRKDDYYVLCTTARMSRNYKRTILTAVLVIGMLSMITMPAAAQTPIDTEDVADVDLSATDEPLLNVLVSLLGGQAIEVDCSFSQDSVDNPQEVCSLTIAGQELGGELPISELPSGELPGGELPSDQLPVLGELLEQLLSGELGNGLGGGLGA
jgi:hypothetical protein